jgi:hypothetical protein
MKDGEFAEGQGRNMEEVGPAEETICGGAYSSSEVVKGDNK